MRPMPRPLAFVLVALLAACHKPTHIEVSPKQPVLRTRLETVQMVGRVMSDKMENAKERVKWSVKDPSIAAIDENGKLSGKQGGRTQVVATYDDLTASVPVEVLLVEKLQSDADAVALSYEAGDPKKPKIEAIGYDGRPLKDRVFYYKSMNEKICRTDGTGQIWPVDKGETTVVASIDDKSIEIKCTVAK